MKTLTKKQQKMEKIHNLNIYIRELREEVKLIRSMGGDGSLLRERQKELQGYITELYNLEK